MTDETWTANRVVKSLEEKLAGSPLGDLFSCACEPGQSEGTCYQLIVREIQGDMIKDHRAFAPEA